MLRYLRSMLGLIKKPRVGEIWVTINDPFDVRFYEILAVKDGYVKYAWWRKGEPADKYECSSPIYLFVDGHKEFKQ